MVRRSCSGGARLSVVEPRESDANGHLGAPSEEEAGAPEEAEMEK